MKTATVKFTCSESPAKSLIDELTAILPTCTPQIRNRALDLINSGAQLVRSCVDRDPAIPADEIRIRLEPADCLTELLAAARASKVHHDVIEHSQSSGEPS